MAAYATAQVVDADLVAGNIKKDVNILGITGTYEGGGGGGDETLLALANGTLTELDIPEGATSIRRYLIYNCTSVQKVILPSTTEALDDYLLFITKYPATNVDLICKAVTPPTCGGTNVFNLGTSKKVSNIYVPSESVDAYKSASGWSAVASLIQAIPE